MTSLLPPAHARPDADAHTSLQHEITGLRGAFATRPGIEQAKGILMSQYGISEATAFAILRRVSMSSHIKIRVLAALLVDAAWRTDPSSVLAQAGLGGQATC